MHAGNETSGEALAWMNRKSRSLRQGRLRSLVGLLFEFRFWQVAKPMLRDFVGLIWKMSLKYLQERMDAPWNFSRKKRPVTYKDYAMPIPFQSSTCLAADK